MCCVFSLFFGVLGVNELFFFGLMETIEFSDFWKISGVFRSFDVALVFKVVLFCVGEVEFRRGRVFRRFYFLKVSFLFMIRSFKSDLNIVCCLFVVLSIDWRFYIGLFDRSRILGTTLFIFVISVLFY